MKKVIITILLLVNISLLVYSYIKSNAKEKSKVEAIEYQTESYSHLQEAKKHEGLALDAAERATKVQYEVEKLKTKLAECQGQ